MWNSVLGPLLWLAAGIMAGYLVRPTINRIYPQTRLSRRMVMSMNDGGAQLFVSTNRLNLPILNIDNLSFFKVMVTHMVVEVTVSAMRIGETAAEGIPQQIQRGNNQTFVFCPLEITEMGRQHIAAIRGSNHGTDCLDATIYIKGIIKTFYDDIPISRNLFVRIQVLN